MKQDNKQEEQGDRIGCCLISILIIIFIWVATIWMALKLIAN